MYFFVTIISGARIISDLYILFCEVGSLVLLFFVGADCCPDMYVVHLFVKLGSSICYDIVDVKLLTDFYCPFSLGFHYLRTMLFRPLAWHSCICESLIRAIWSNLNNGSYSRIDDI